MLSQNRTHLFNERSRNSFRRFPSMDFASAFSDEEVGETRYSAALLIPPPKGDDTHDPQPHLPTNHCESLMLESSSIHTIGLNYDSVEHQLSVLERDSDDLFDSLLGTKRKQNSSSSLLVPVKESTAFPSAKSLQRDSISFNFNEELGYNDIDHLFTSEDTASGQTSRSKFTSDFSSSILVSKESTGHQDSKKNKKPTAEAMHAFNQEYEARLNDLRQCMSRTKSSRSRVAKLKQVMKQRCLTKYSYRNKLAKSVGINTSCTDYSRQKILQSQMYLNQVSVSNSSLQSTTGDELSRHSSRSNTPSSHAITLE